jgi:hypothetical protein
MTFINYEPDPQFDNMRMFMNNGGQGINFDNEINTIVLESFKGTKKFLYIGVMAFLFYFMSAYVFIGGFVPAIEAQTNG